MLAKILKFAVLSLFICGLVAPASANTPPPPVPALTTFTAGAAPLTAGLAPVPAPTTKHLDPAALSRFLKDAGGPQVRIAEQTGTVRFVRFSGPQAEQMAAALGKPAAPEAQAAALWQNYGSVFGIQDPARELALTASEKDAFGLTHLAYQQTYQGLPVFGAQLKAHFNRQGQMAAVNGLFVPQIDLDAAPALSAQQAGALALGMVDTPNPAVLQTTLMVYRTGLAQGVPGDNHLVYEVEVGNGSTTRDFIYVDAHTGKLVDRIAGIHELDRIVYDHNGGDPLVVWQEGDPAYTGGSADVQSLIDSTQETFNLYYNISGKTFPSFTGTDTPMISVAHYDVLGYCPNASWNGVVTRFCSGMAVDDVIAHEWAHAYTQYTHGLIYAWQPGALNEAYSDIFGEAVDLLNGRELDDVDPNTRRVDGSCHTGTPFPGELVINSPLALAGTYENVGTAQFGPQLPLTGITADLVLAQDGYTADNGTVVDGCQPFTNAAEVSGKIALIERGTCNFTVKVKNAQNAGAVAAIVYNNSLNGEKIMNMGGSDPSVAIPSLLVARSLGLSLVDALPGVNVTARKNSGGIVLDDSLRWLIGEGSSMGALRDMWNPTCHKQPAKVSDPNYYCGVLGNNTDDYGGVHYNSGVPNKAFALLVDGGSFNGQTVSPLGWTKALALYWEAALLQNMTSDFTDHADMLEMSCALLTGAQIYDPLTGDVSGEVITAGDCQQVAKAVAAVELRAPPAQCGYQPILAKDTPAMCTQGTRTVGVFNEDFDGGADGWLVSATFIGEPPFDTPNWALTDTSPLGNPSLAAFAENGDYGDCINDDEAGVRLLASPEIQLTRTDSYLSFMHYMATELGYDGGNVWVQVGEKAPVLIKAEDYTFNPYNVVLYDWNVGSNNPLMTLPAFSGRDPGSVAGSWGVSRVNLKPYVAPGETFRLVFAMSQDACTGVLGWAVDNIDVYHCDYTYVIPVIGR
jgi:Zn-dependent metalloprotease